MSSARIESTYARWMSKIAKIHLHIIDDFGISPLDNNIRLTLLDILEDRYGKYPVIITSQLPFNKWHEYISEPTLADAILDRLTAHAHKITLKGASKRREK